MILLVYKGLATEPTLVLDQITKEQLFEYFDVFRKGVISTDGYTYTLRIFNK